MDRNKYPGYNEDDTFWDEHHKKRGMLTNREFFSTNGPGSFYEGMEWDESVGDWVSKDETTKRCHFCSREIMYCECED